MTLLLDFLCRFGWGLSAALAVTSPAVVPGGFFRVNLLVVMGLATFAALLAASAGVAGAWLPPAALAVVAWVGGIAWLGERRTVGRTACLIAAALGAVATIVTAGHAAEPRAAAGAILSGLVTGLTVHAMLLGHWYLNAPGMRVDALRRAIDHALMAWGAQLVASLVVVGPQFAALTSRADPTAPALVALRWLAGLVGLPVLLLMARRTLDIPNTQSATGILYVACLAAILGELTAQLLRAAS
jgi:hypothetical protein